VANTALMRTMTLILTGDRRMTVLADQRALQLAMADGIGRIGVQDAHSGEWRWIALDEIVAADERLAA
jgi:hypothetical protein